MKNDIESWSNDLGGTVSDSNDETKDYSKSTVMDIINQRISTNSRITRDDVDDINAIIVDDHYRIYESYNNDCLGAEAFRLQAEVSESVRNRYNIELDATEIPAFVESEIGTSKTPDDLQKEADESEKSLDVNFEKDIKDFYEKVHEIDSFDFSNVSSKVTGLDKNLNKVTPVLITVETRNILGKGYEKYCQESVQNLANNLAKKYSSNFDFSKNSIDNENTIDISAGKLDNKDRYIPSSFTDICNQDESENSFYDKDSDASE